MWNFHGYLQNGMSSSFKVNLKKVKSKHHKTMNHKTLKTYILSILLLGYTNSHGQENGVNDIGFGLMGELTFSSKNIKNFTLPEFKSFLFNPKLYLTKDILELKDGKSGVLASIKFSSLKKVCSIIKRHPKKRANSRYFNEENSRY